MTTFLVEIIKPSQYGPAAYAFIGLQSINPDNLLQASRSNIRA